jgi:hypothetical protein
MPVWMAYQPSGRADKRPRDAVDHHHCAGVEVRALSQQPAGQSQAPLANRFVCDWDASIFSAMRGLSGN